ncbi:division/cell wall cluster transcriptional repressor MraZ [Thiolinea disciformis]|uniref:division/cell wall cluster transcriptional repressor MraZ n=1 Tax=Thiolinea disciformis TaxID=125614 RepID=UPI0003728074|nr:division/cell wall cluster transcriptional repressor MraZ [Thiolinea disciformis]
MFRGISHIAIDNKGRIAIPAKYREMIAEQANSQMVLTVDHTDDCLLLYPMNQWVKFEQTLMALPNMNRRVRNMQRLLLGHAAELELDTQGRLLLPTPLRDYAHLDKRAVLVGQANKFELWDEERWFSARETWLQEAQDDEDAHDLLNQVSM